MTRRKTRREGDLPTGPVNWENEGSSLDGRPKCLTRRGEDLLFERLREAHPLGASGGEPRPPDDEG